MRSRAFRIVVWLANAAAAVASVIVVAVTAAAGFIDPNDYKARLVDAVQDATGRRLTIGGDLQLTKSLWPTLVANDVALANLPGGSRPDMAHAERIEAQLSLLALLDHQVDLTRLTLIGPNILFEQVGGQPNWVFDGGTAPPPDPASPGYALRIDSAHVRDGMVTWRLPARTKVVGIRSLDYRQRRVSRAVEAHATLVYSDNQPFQLDIQATPSGGVMAPWQTQLHFAAFDTEATAQGTVQIAGPYDLQVQAKSAAVEKLNALLPEMNLPALHGATLAGHIANGARPGDIPVIGPVTLQFTSADLRALVPGLVLGATKLSLPAVGGQAAVDGSGQYAGTGFHLSGSLGVPAHPDGKATVPVALSLAVDKAAGTMTLKGTLALDTLQFAGLDGTATLQAKALSGLRPMLGASLPALTEVRLTGRVSVPATAGRVRLRDVTLQSAQGDVSGEGSIDPGATLSLDGQWRSGSLDLDAMLEAFGIDLSGPAAPRPSTGPMIPDTPLPWAALRGPALDLAVAIGSMQFQGQVWRDVQATVALAGGRLKASPVSVAMPGSRMQAALTVDASVAAAPVTFSLSAPALPLQLVGGYFGLPGPIAGTAAISAQWRSSGQTMRQLASMVDGPFSIAAVGGQLTNRAMIALTGAALQALSIEVPPQGQTRLECLGLAGSFAQGVGTLRTIALQTTYLSLEGAGQVDLRRETVALKVQPMAQVAGSPVSVPVVIQGPFRDVSGKLDAGGLQQLGFLIDGIFGGDTSTACAKAGLVPAR